MRGTGAHIGPVDVAGGGIDRDAIRHMTSADDHLPIRAVGAHRMDASTAQLEEEQSTDGALAADWGCALGASASVISSLLREIGQVLSAENRLLSFPERSPGRGRRRCAEGDASATDEPALTFIEKAGQHLQSQLELAVFLPERLLVDLSDARLGERFDKQNLVRDSEF